MALARRRAMLAGVVALLAGAAAADVELRADQQRLGIALRGGLPSLWLSCDGRCEDGGSTRRMLVGPGEGMLEWTGNGALPALSQLQYRAETRESPQALTAVLTAIEPFDGRILVQRYELSLQTRVLHMTLQVPPGVGLRIASGPDLVPPPLPGFGAAFSRIAAVRVAPDGQEKLEPTDAAGSEFAVPADAWLGLRSRFWAWLAQPAVAGSATVAATAQDRREIIWPAQENAIELAFYAGPIDWKDLRVVAPTLTQMLFASLWEPLRWLCYGLYFLLAVISSWVTNPGIAIILLSLAVKIVLTPLTHVADRWQQEVNRKQSRIQPRIAEIRRSHRGEEAHRLTLQVYREEGVHPLFTLKSLAGFAIQVPMFIAAFDMLADNFALSGARFLWVDDLAAPDRFLPLPFVLPFFGAHLNLLPLVMTAVTLVSAVTLREASLTPALLRKQQHQLYLMAGAFFLLFYTFPAGMVLYWTANNVWHLLKVQLLQRVRLVARP